MHCAYLFFFFICSILLYLISFFFFFNDTATTEIYTLSLHDALPICAGLGVVRFGILGGWIDPACVEAFVQARCRSEEHTSELQSRSDLVCRLLLEKKKKNNRESCLCNVYRTITT